LVAMLEKIKYSTTEQERKYYWEKVWKNSWQTASNVV
jgi:hypothetical protein